MIGNLQAVLDEYAHMTQTKALGHAVTEAIIGTSNLGIDTTDSLGMEEKKQLMRCHFAIPFIDKTVTDNLSPVPLIFVRHSILLSVRSCFQQLLLVRKVLIFIGMQERLFIGTYLPILWI